MPKPLAPNRTSEKATTSEPAPLEVQKKAMDRYVIGSSNPAAEIPKVPEPKPVPVEAPEPPPKPEPVAPETKAGETSEDTDDLARPGLGRMFGNQKKSTRELFKQAATAYTAFKPRAGGAAAKLLVSQPKSNEPDGITGVVPAPFLLNRTKTAESATSFGSDSNSIQKTPTSAIGAKQSLPDLRLTSPGATERKAEQLPLRKDGVSAVKSLSDLQIAAAEAQQKSKAAEEEAARKKLRRTPQQTKYLERLGVDAAKLEGVGLEYEALLEEFWPESCWHKKSVEQLQGEIRRELSRVQTGSWFEHLALHEKGRNEAIQLIDSTMDEAEEFEKLLTIYGVELGVSILVIVRY
jgi:exocyst complex component 1